jgi:hypothetical protein
VERDEVRLLEQRAERGQRAVVAHRQLGHDVVVDDAQAERLGEHAELLADMAVADDAQRLAADLVASARDLPPDAGVHLARSITELPREEDELADDHLGDAPRVAEGRVEDRDTPAVRRHQIDLVYADTEAADREQRVGRLEDARADV